MDEGDRSLRAVIFRTREGGAAHRKLRHAKEIASYCGITEDGVATDIWVGLCTTSWECVPVEDALLILADVKQWVKRKNKPKAPRAPKAKKEPAQELVEVTWR